MSKKKTPFKQFEFRITNKNGTRKVKVVAKDRQTALRGVGRIGISDNVEFVREQKLLFKPKPKDSEMMLFYRTMSRMLERQDSELRAMQTAALQIKDPVLLGIIGDMSRDDGSKISDIVKEHLDVFGNSTYHLYRAGEAAGTLQQVYERLALEYKDSRELAKKLKQAVRMPMFNVVMMLILGLAFLLYLVPTQVDVMTKRGIELPKITLMMADVSNWLATSTSGWIIISGIVALVWLQRKALNRWEPWDRRKMDIPFFGRFYALVRMHKLTQQLSSMLACGVAEATAYGIVTEIAVNVRIKAFFREAGKGLNDGKTYAQSYYECADHAGSAGLYMASMMKIADQTGEPVVVLDDICADWKSEIDYMTSTMPEIVNMVMTVAYLVLGAGMMIMIWVPYILGMQGLQDKFNSMTGL